MELKEVSYQAEKIREKQIHGTVWSLEENALAFLTDATMVVSYFGTENGIIL